MIDKTYLYQSLLKLFCFLISLLVPAALLLGGLTRPITAIQTVQAITGAKTIDTLGFCVGGTILSTALAVLAARGQHPAESMTLLTTFVARRLPALPSAWRLLGPGATHASHRAATSAATA